MKEIEKYVGYYLGVYVFVLAICGFFQYFYNCQGQSLMCAVSMDRINTIITTTAYVLTPIVAIIGFLSWKNQFNAQTISKLSFQAINLLNINFNKQVNLLNWIIDKKDSLNELKSSEVFDQIRYEVRENTNHIYSLISDLSRITTNDQLSTSLDDWKQASNIFMSDLKLLKIKLILNQLNSKLNEPPEHEVDFIKIYIELNKSNNQLLDEIRQYTLV